MALQTMKKTTPLFKDFTKWAWDKIGNMSLNQINYKLKGNLKLGNAKRVEKDISDEDWHVHFNDDVAIYLKDGKSKHGNPNLNAEDKGVVNALKRKYDEEITNKK